jgi:hypothetical protein
MQISNYVTAKSQRRRKIRKDSNIISCWIKTIVCTCFVFVIPENVIGQAGIEDVIGQAGIEDDSQAIDQIWIDFYPHFYVSEEFEYYGDTGFRTNINNSNWYKITARPSVRYHFDKYWTLHGGVGFFYDFNKEVSNRFEIRPWEGIQLGWPRIINLGVQHYVKFEQRISYLTDDWSSSLALRLRYMLSFRWDIIKMNKNKFWFIPVFGEVFFPVGDEVKEFFRDRGRLGVGLGYNPSDIWRFSFHVVWQKTHTGIDEDYSVSDIFYQIKVRKYINVEKVKTLFDD